MDVSVIIVNWNTKEVLKNCIASVLEETKNLEFEVIVVDNGSNDGSAHMVKTDFPRAKLIKNAINRGFAAANNQAMAVANGRYILLLNSDTIVLDNAIPKTVSFADEHSTVAVVGCRVLNPDRTLQPTCFMFPSALNLLLSSSYLYKFFPRNKFFGRERMLRWDRTNARQVDVVTGCFMLVRSKAIKEVGIMDERFFMYGEETDWCYRFKKAGWKISFMPDAQIIHLAGQSTKQAASEMILQVRVSILKFVRKHKSKFEYKIAYFLVWLFFALRIPIWFVRFLIDKSKRSYCRIRLAAYLNATKKLIAHRKESLCP